MRCLADFSIGDLAPKIKRREISPVQLVEKMLKRIQRLDHEVNAYITVLSSQALSEAEAAAKEIAEGRYRGPLHGIPIGVKDNIQTKGTRTTAASKTLADYIPATDAAVIERLREAGAILIGKHNLYEFAYGYPSSYSGPSPNPWNTLHISGGSSSGSAAAVAARLCYGALGTDTGGSVRIPAAMCGVAGMVPTRGCVSNYGVLPSSKSHDRIGPIARSTEDVALILQAVASYDKRDERSVRVDVCDYMCELKKGISGMRILVDTLSLNQAIKEVRESVEKAVMVLSDQGAEVRWQEVQCLQWARSVQRLISVCEAAAVHEENLKSRPEDYGEKLKERLRSGQMVLGTAYIGAMERRALFLGEIGTHFGEADVIVTPTVPFPAPPSSEELVYVEDKAYAPYSLPLDREFGGMELQVTDFTCAASLGGLPAMTVPCGFSQSGLPIGMQLMASPFNETKILRAAYAYETVTSWHRRCPPRFN